MKKFILCILVLILQIFLPVFAYQPVILKVTPAHLISTKKNSNIEVGDILEFKTIRDTYKNDKLFIKKDTSVYGLVGNVHENGFAGDTAEIVITKFKTKDINGNAVYISNKLTISGNMEFANFAKNFLSFLSEIFIVIRGSEIYLEPGKHVFNIMYTPK